MNRAEIQNCFDSVKQEVLNNLNNSLKDTIKEKLKQYSNEDNKIDPFNFAIFAYTEALMTSIRVNNEITLNTLIKMFADD